jgi:hypothetical protein
MSEASASMKPPPQAGPCTQARNTWGTRRILMASWLMRCCPRSDPATLPSPPKPVSFRSRPAQKARPAPRSTTMRVAGSPARESSSAWYSSTNFALKVLSASGRFSVHQSTGPSRRSASVS